MELEEEEWVGQALKESERKKCISKILSIRRKDAVDKGNNFVSDIYRLKVKVVTNSGDVEERSVIYKIIPVDGQDKMPGIRELGLFRIESRMYQETLAAMGRLLKSKDPSEEILWAEFFGVRGNYEGFLVEDLSVYGYEMIDRQKGLDFQHTSVCLKNLAKFHALAATVLDNGTANDKDLLEMNFFIPTGEMLKQSRGLLGLINAIKADWPSEWHSYLDGLQKLYHILVLKITEIYKNSENMFTAINHGDFWTNNVLFKYDSSGKLMDNMRFVDFQLCYAHSPCYDIQFLFSTSLRYEFFDKKPELLKVYHESLEKYLKLFGYSKTLPTYEDLQRDFETTRMFGYFITLIMRTVMRNPPMHELLEKFDEVPDDENKWEVFFRHDGEEYLTVVRHTLQQLREIGLL